MKLFKSKCDGEIVIILNHISYLYSIECRPSIHINVNGTSAELRYESNDMRDQDYDNLIKELNGDADWERDLPRVRAMLEGLGLSRESSYYT